MISFDVRCVSALIVDTFHSLERSKVKGGELQASYLQLFFLVPLENVREEFSRIEEWNMEIFIAREEFQCV